MTAAIVWIWTLILYPYLRVLHYFALTFYLFIYLIFSSISCDFHLVFITNDLKCLFILLIFIVPLIWYFVLPLEYLSVCTSITLCYRSKVWILYKLVSVKKLTHFQFQPRSSRLELKMGQFLYFSTVLPTLIDIRIVFLLNILMISWWILIRFDID